MTGKALESFAPAVRLALTGKRRSSKESERDRIFEAPVVRLAHCRRSSKESERDRIFEAPVVRLAHCPGAQGDNVLLGQKGVKRVGDPTIRLATPLKSQKGANSADHLSEQIPKGSPRVPALLISFVYLDPFIKNRHRYAYRDWALDSGAFSAHQIGTEIDLKQYIEVCKEQLTLDPTLVEIFALDVIGNWRASLKNCEKMWEAGVPAIPCYHVDEPESALLQMARDYPKIALGGVALAKGGRKMGWAAQCFARVWPKKIHGFGFGTKTSVLGLPFHSTDATNWEIGPCKFGRWASFKADLSVRGSKQDLRSEIEWYLKLEEEAARHWKKEMAILDAMPPHSREIKR